MKFISTQLAAAFVSAIALVGCATSSTDTGGVGGVEVNLVIGNTDVTSVAFNVTCDSGVDLDGEFNVNDENDPPVWGTIMDLPVGDCTITITASDDAGEPLCTGSADFTVVAGETVKVNLVLTCGVTGNEPRGNVDVDVTFETVVANNCPDLYFFNVVPDEVPASGSNVTVLVSDPDGDVLSTQLTATGGSFADASATSTTYSCDGANGAQTVFVAVSDGTPECDKAKSFDVTCPGVNLCDGVTCDDDGNVCTTESCNQSTGQCETSNNDGADCGTNGSCSGGSCVEVDLCEGVVCGDTGNECTVGVCNPQTGVCDETNDDGAVCGGGGGTVELTTNGDFETGALNIDDDPANGWTLFCAATNGICEATMDEANGGLWSGNLIVSGGAGDAVIKNANIGIGTVQPESPVTISFDIKGATADGGVVFVEFFSELSGGGVSKAELLGGAPIFPTDDWQTFTFETTTGDDVSGGVTLQLKSSCGAVPTCNANAFFDNASVTVETSGGEPGTCGGGICVPDAECSVDADCPATGNECVDPVCNAGTCGTSNNTNTCNGGNGTCNEGVCEPNSSGGTELTTNGDFETGALNIDDDPANGWTLFCAATNGICEATMDEANGGLWSSNLIVSGGAGDAVIKNANIGIGTVLPESPVTISFDIKGTTADGGVVFVEFFSELSGGGVSKAELLGGAPIFPTDDWQTFTFETTTGDDVSGGVTLQLKSSCGAVPTCNANAFFDNASVIVP